MPLYENCIHWRVCALACPLDVKECRHFKAEGDEIKHGHWTYDIIDGKEWAFCSVCGDGVDDDNMYCPWCGAKMDEGEVQI